MCWTGDPVTIIGFNFDHLTLVQKYVVQFLDEFKVMSSHTIISLDRGEESEIDKYLSKFEVIETIISKIFIRRVSYAFIMCICR